MAQVEAGELNEWIALFMMELVPDGQGGDMEMIPQNLVCDRPAAVRMVTGRRTVQGDQIADRIEYEFKIRYEPSVTTDYRVLWRDAYLDIEMVQNIDIEDKFLLLRCTKRERGVQ